jgi:hypothetical protein
MVASGDRCCILDGCRCFLFAFFVAFFVSSFFDSWSFQMSKKTQDKKKRARDEEEDDVNVKGKNHVIELSHAGS